MGSLIDKLMFYIGFLDSFIERGEKLLKENDIQSLKMLREYIIDARNLLKTIKRIEKGG